MRLSIDFVTGEGDESASATISEALGALVGLMVDLEVDNDGYPHEDVYVLRVDGDGDLVVADTPERNSTWAIPQLSIRRVRVPLGSAS